MYLVQAILFDGNSERVINSTKTEDADQALHSFMALHRNSLSYKYFVMELSSQRVVQHSNIYH